MAQSQEPRGKSLVSGEDYPISNSQLNRSNIEQDQLSKVSEEFGRENIEYERYRSRLAKATAKQNHIFDQYYNNILLP